MSVTCKIHEIKYKNRSLSNIKCRESVPGIGTTNKRQFTLDCEKEQHEIRKHFDALTFEEGSTCLSFGWYVCRSPIPCATYNFGMLNPIDFDLGTFIHLNEHMNPITQKVSGSRSF